MAGTTTVEAKGADLADMLFVDGKKFDASFGLLSEADSHLGDSDEEPAETTVASEPGYNPESNWVRKKDPRTDRDLWYA